MTEHKDEFWNPVIKTTLLNVGLSAFLFGLMMVFPESEIVSFHRILLVMIGTYSIALIIVLIIIYIVERKEVKELKEIIK